MSRRPTAALENPLCAARLKAADYDNRLLSREKTAELLGISFSQLSDYELGITKIIPPDSIVRMADLYNQPELKNLYCRTVCPIGCDFPEVTEETLDRSTIKTLSVLGKVEWVRDSLLKITEDGKITDDEWDEFTKIIEVLEEIEKISQELKNHAFKVRR